VIYLLSKIYCFKNKYVTSTSIMQEKASVTDDGAHPLHTSPTFTQLLSVSN